MRVQEVMSPNPLTVKCTDDLALATQVMLWANVRHLVVLGNAGDVVGVLSERDLLQHRARRGREGLRDRVEAAMSQPPVTIDAGADLATAEGQMLVGKRGCLPVVERGDLVGILTTSDVVRSALDRDFGREAAQPPSRVAAIMKRAPAVVAPGSLLYDAVALMVDRHVRHLPVVDASGRVVGMLSDRDVRAVVGDPLQAVEDPAVRARLRDMLVEAVMTRTGVTVNTNATVPEVARLLLRQDVGALPVVNGEQRLMGIVSYVDVIRALL